MAVDYGNVCVIIMIISLRTIFVSVHCGPLYCTQVTYIICFFFTFGCCIPLHISPAGSLWRLQSQQSFNTSTPPLFSFSLHAFLHFYILYVGPVFTENFNDFTIFMFVLSLITCIGDYGSKYRCTTYNISTSSYVLATDPLY
jgi:hypothetical protein